MKKFFADFAKVKILILILTAVALIKEIFVGVDLDEVFQLSMGYRLSRGDVLLSDIWDAYQTTAYPVTILMKLYYAIVPSGVGVLIFLRFVGALISVATGLVMYGILKAFSSNRVSFILTSVYVVFRPKGFITPDYSNISVWAQVLILGLLIALIMRGDALAPVKRKMYSFLIGICMCLLVLGYPGCTLLCVFFAVFMICMAVIRGKSSLFADNGMYAPKGTDILMTLLGVIVFAAVYFGCLIGKLGTYGFAQGLNNSFSALGSGVHNMPGQILKSQIVDSLPIVLLYFGVYAAVALVICLIRKNFKDYAKYMLLTGFAIQVVHFLYRREILDRLHSFSYMILILILSIIIFIREKGKRKIPAALACGTSVFGYLSIQLFTNHPIFPTIGYIVPGMLMTVALMVSDDKETKGYPEGVDRVFVLAFSFTLIFVSFWRIPASLMRNVTDARSIVRVGPCAGVLCETDVVREIRYSYEDFTNYAPEGAKLYIGYRDPRDYMDHNYEVCSPITDNPYVFGEFTPLYWELHPDKYPEVIALPYRSGEYYKLDDNDDVIEFAEKDFGADRIEDGVNYRFFIRER